MNKLINRKVLISMIFIGLTMMGLFSYRYLLMELYPDAEFPSLNVTISTKTELDPKYIESQAAIPVEGVISGLEGVEDITTLISNRNARITVSFTKNTNVKYAYLKLEEKIKAITKSIPEDFTIQVNKAGSGMASDQFMTLQILGDDDVDYVRNITDIDIAPILESTDGIASVTVMGGRQKSIEILLDDEKCKALNITASQVSSLIGKNMSEKTFAGSVFQDNKRFFVNVTAEYLATEDLGNIVVSEGPVLLKDIADINFGIKEEESYSRVNGKEVITCVISKSPLVNIIDLSQRVREEIAQLNEELATKGVSIKVDTDTAETMSENINTIIMTMMMSASAAATIMTMSIITIMMTMMTNASAAATIMTMSIITIMTTMMTSVSAAATIMITIITITMQMRSSQAGAWRMWLLARKKSWRHFYRICLRVMFTDRFSVQRV